MKQYVQPGEILEWTAPANVTKDVPVQIGQVLTVPTVTVLSGARFNGLMRGVVEATKVGSQAWAEGAIVYWDEANLRFTTSPTGNLRAGFATEAVGAGAGETTGKVYLEGVARIQEET